MARFCPPGQRHIMVVTPCHGGDVTGKASQHLHLVSVAGDSTTHRIYLPQRTSSEYQTRLLVLLAATYVASSTLCSLMYIPLQQCILIHKQGHYHNRCTNTPSTYCWQTSCAARVHPCRPTGLTGGMPLPTVQSSLHAEACAHNAAHQIVWFCCAKRSHGFVGLHMLRGKYIANRKTT